MMFSNSPLTKAFVALLFLSPHLLAAPVNELQTSTLVSRAVGDSETDPIEASFNIAGWEDIAEENCYIMLCVLNGRRVYKRNVRSSDRTTNNRNAGAANEPFQDDGLRRYGTTRIGPETISPEEFPWESIGDADGYDRHVISATTPQQQAQSGALSSGISVVPWNKWFRITFEPASSFKRYCTALHQDPPNTDICHQKDIAQTLFGVAQVVLSAGYVYHKIKEANGGVSFGKSKVARDQDDAVFVLSNVTAEYTG